MARTKQTADTILWPVFLMLTKPADMKGEVGLRDLIRHLEQTEHGAGSQGGRVATFDVASTYVPLTEAQQSQMQAIFEGRPPKDWRDAAVTNLRAALAMIPREETHLRRAVDSLTMRVQTWEDSAPQFSGPPVNPDPERIAARPYAITRREINTGVGRVLSDSEKGEVQEV